MALIGAILGDISGSQFEFDRCENPDTCELFSKDCMFTDDTVMSLAVKQAIDQNIPFEKAMHMIGRLYPDCGFGGRFYEWMFKTDSKPYNSFGNGSAMRVSYVADAFDDIEKVQEYAKKSAIVSHNHTEGIKGACVTATCIWMAKHGKSKEDIYNYVLEEYPPSRYIYPISKSIEELAIKYEWNETCHGSVPVAMRCFYESDSYESFLRNVYRIECDTDTIAAIGGGVAEEYYSGTMDNSDSILEDYLDDTLLAILKGEYHIF